MFPKFPVGTENTIPPGGIPRQVIEAGEPVLRQELVVCQEHLHQVLAVVEGPLDCHGVDVALFDRGHLSALDLGHPALWVEDDDIDVRSSPQRFDRRRAGVARGSTEDQDALSGALQCRLHHRPEQRHGVVLEREGGSPGEVEQPVVGGQLLEWRDIGMAEPPVARLRHRLHLFGSEEGSGERRHHHRHDFCVGAPR
jgi:hypothetical protein